MERKIVSISPKRQITIPIKFFEALGFTGEAECILKDNEIVIRPANIYNQGAFADLILEELIEEGYAGQSLLSAFRDRQGKVRPAVEAMLEEANQVARGEKDYADYSDIFDLED